MVMDMNMNMDIIMGLQFTIPYPIMLRVMYQYMGQDTMIILLDMPMGTMPLAHFTIILVHSDLLAFTPISTMTNKKVCFTNQLNIRGKNVRYLENVYIK